MKIEFSSQGREMLFFLVHQHGCRDVTCKQATGLRWQEAQLKIETFAQICFEKNFIRKRYIHTTKPFESVNEILWCDHFNEASLAILSHGAICFSAFYKMKFENRCQTLTLVITFGSKRVIMLLKKCF